MDQTVPFHDRMILEHAKGLSFADVGGLWNTVNEKVTLGARAGASSLAMIDMQPAGNDWWKKFRAHADEKGVKNGTVKEIVANLDAPDFASVAGNYDFVHSSGILYHVPSPIHSLLGYRSIVNRYLLLGSMVVPETINNEKGSIDFSKGDCLFIPAMKEENKAIVRAHFEPKKIRIPHISQRDQEFPFWENGKPNYAPWWWLYSPSTLCGMLTSIGFRVISWEWTWSNLAMHVFCEKI